MQLIVFALMLMALGKNANLKEIKPILESFGGEQATEVIKQAEELNSVISAVQSLATLTKSPTEDSASAGMGAAVNADLKELSCAPLAPVARIADEDITDCLSRYIALGE